MVARGHRSGALCHGDRTVILGKGMKTYLLLAAVQISVFAQGVIVLKPSRVFDSETMHEGWSVRVKGDRIEAVGPAASVDASGANVVDLANTTLLPGLVE